jgi:hypothetical protein
MERDSLLSLSQAARMAGVKRRTLQRKIQEGVISVFEGYIRLSELRKAYPDLEAVSSGMIERMDRIKQVALFKPERTSLPDREQLAGELHRLRIRLGEVEGELDQYRQLTVQLRDRLYGLQEQCDRNQAVMLETVLSWLLHQMKMRH